MRLVIPKNPLAADSMKFESIDLKTFSTWDDDDHLDSYELMQRVVLICKEKEITDYFIYGLASNSPKSIFNWEIVPHPKDSWLLGKQLRVLWNITFGGLSILREEQERRAEHLRQELELFPHSEQTTSPAIHENDVFCNQDIIKRERIFEGKEINVLCSRFGSHDEIHFLLAPKRHRQGFTDLTESEYVEAMQLSRKLVKFYKGEGYGVAHLFHKTGAAAGQVIPHWITQIVFSRTKTQDFFGKLVLAKNLLIGSSPLTEEMFQHRIASFREELGEALSA